MNSSYVREDSRDSIAVGNDAFRLTVGLDGTRTPVVTSLVLSSAGGAERAAVGRPLAPLLVVRQVAYSPSAGNMAIALG